VQETVDKQKVTPKKMNALATRGLNAVRQKIRKLNKDYETDINTYREDKDAYMEEEEVVVKVERRRPNKRDTVADGQVEDDDEGGWEGVGKDGRALKYTPESILKHLRSIVESRGRKNTDRLEQIRIMEKLYDVAATDYQKIRVLLTIISTRFDLTSNTGNFMAQEQWRL
jgi:translation initiation factor 3 subunit C